MSPLAFARRLIDAGVPVFAAQPDPDGRTPSGRATGYTLPSQWQRFTADPKRLEVWREGWALCAVGGHGIDFLDVDPRNGGLDAVRELLEADAWPKVYAAVTTPSGGVHNYVASLGISKTKRAGIDLQGGSPDGPESGRGFVFLPGTVRASKATGRPEPYTLLVDALDTFGQDDNSGAPFRSWVTAAKPVGASATGDGELGTPIPAGEHDDTLNRYAAVVTRHRRDPAEAVALVVARGRDCVPPWESGMKPGDETLEERARKHVASALAKFGPAEDPDDFSAWPAMQRAVEALDATPAAVEPLASPSTEVAIDAFSAAVAGAAEKLRIAAAARRLVEDERVALEFCVPASRFTLVEELAEPDPPVAYAIDKLLPAGGNALLAAGFKAGKTTLLNNLVRSIADGSPFLGRFPVADHGGRIAVFNYEVGEGQFRAWIRSMRIQNPDRVAVWNLRGHRLPLGTSQVEDAVVAWLRARDVRTWIVDPLGRALAGADENSNTEVRAMLDTLDVIKERAGVLELIVAAHTGRGIETQDRVRGATVLDDWPDARWILVRDDLGSRFLRASGRDVEVEEEALSFESTTRAITFGGWDRVTTANRAAVEKGLPLVVESLTTSPGLGVRELREALAPMRAADVDAAVREGVRLGRIEVVTRGQKHCHYLPGQGREVA